MQNSAVGSSLELQQRIEKIYDHLYANAPVRTPAGISAEVGKVLHAAMFKEENGEAPTFQFDRSELAGLTNGSSLLGSHLADEVRRWFEDMNAAWRLYEREAQIALDDFDIDQCRREELFQGSLEHAAYLLPEGFPPLEEQL